METVLGGAYAGSWPAWLPWARSAVQPLEHTIPAALPPGIDSLRIAFASDLHAGPTTPRALLEEAFEQLRRFRPHLLLLGGDYVLFDARHVEHLVPLIESVEAPLGRYAVLGNHDLWSDDAAITRSLARAGATVLVNQAVRLPELPDVSVGGLDDAWAGAPRYKRAFAPRGPVHLLLMHSPDHVPHLANRHFAVAMCGHTHGGHIALPGGRPLLMPTSGSWRYSAGRYELPGGPLLVSRGVGQVEVPFRLFAPPDVLWIRLQASSG